MTLDEFKNVNLKRFDISSVCLMDNGVLLKVEGDMDGIGRIAGDAHLKDCDGVYKVVDYSGSFVFERMCGELDREDSDSIRKVLY